MLPTFLNNHFALQEREAALARKAPILAELVGYGLSGDAHHITAPEENGSGAQRCMRAALREAQISPQDVDYINAHATSTPVGDVIEARAIGGVFGNQVAVSSSKVGGLKVVLPMRFPSHIFSL